MKKKVVIVVTMAVVILSVVAYFIVHRPNPISPDEYRKLSRIKWERIHKRISPNWSIDDRVSKDLKLFVESGEEERRCLFKELQKEVED